MKKKAAPIKSEIPFVQALRARFSKEHYVVLTGVTIKFGAGTRTADVLVIGKSPSIDLSIYGFEIKSSRANWTYELKNPEKSEPGTFYCDRWSLFAYPGVADSAEIPPLWGHWILDGGIKVEKEAPDLKPNPIDRHFMAKAMDALVLQASENLELLSSKADYERGVVDGKARGHLEADAGHGYIEQRLVRQAKEIEELKAKIRFFGFDGLYEHQINEILETAKFFKKNGLHRMKETMEAIDLFKNADLDTIKVKLEELHSKASFIKEMIQKRLDILPPLMADRPAQDASASDNAKIIT